MCIVDAVYGNDATGARSGLPFLTPAAALAGALPGDVVWILPGTYNLAAPLVVPNGVSISGLNHRASALLRLAVAVDAVLLTMGENSVVENISLTLTSAEHHVLTGVLFPGTTAATSGLEGCDVLVDNSGAGDGGTSNVYGVRSTGNGSNNNNDAIKDGSITVLSAGLGVKRGILVDTAAAMFSCRNAVVDVYRTGIGAGSYIGCETNVVGCELFFRLGTIDAPATADISQTLGTLTLGIGIFLNHTANSKGLFVVANPLQMDWGDSGAVANGTRYLYRGTALASNGTIPGTRLAQAACCFNLSVRAATGPGGIRVDTWTLFINGVATALSTSLTGAATTALTNGISVTAQLGDVIGMRQVGAAGSGTTDVQVVCSFL